MPILVKMKTITHTHIHTCTYIRISNKMYTAFNKTLRMLEDPFDKSVLELNNRTDISGFFTYHQV